MDKEQRWGKKGKRMGSRTEMAQRRTFCSNDEEWSEHRVPMSNET